jgi:hypothetical protein
MRDGDAAPPAQRAHRGTASRRPARAARRGQKKKIVAIPLPPIFPLENAIKLDEMTCAF